MIGIAVFAVLMAGAIVYWSKRGPTPVAAAVALVPFVLLTLQFVMAPRLPINDSYHFHFPVFEYVGSALATTGTFPDWLPVGGGIRAGVLQIPLIYFTPHRLVGYALYAWTPLSAVTAYKAAYVFGVVLLSAGWWLFLRRLTGSRLAASFGTLSLALGGTGITFHQEQVLGTTYLVPWFLLAAWHVGRDRALVFAIAMMFGLAATLHYPHILLVSFVVLVVACMVFYGRSTIERLRAAWSLSALPAVLLFLICLAPLVYVLPAMAELTSPLRFLRGAALTAATFEDYVRLAVEAMPDSSARPTRYWLYLRTAVSPEHPDMASYFVGRMTLLLGVVALVLRPRLAGLLIVLAVCYALLAAGIRSPVPAAEALFALSPVVMGMFRQWFHFFPMINFCLSALAAVGLAGIVHRFEGRGGPILIASLTALFAFHLFDLAAFAQRYITAFTVAERPAAILETGMRQQARLGIASRKTLLQYRERTELDACCASRIPNEPFVTTMVESMDGDFGRQLTALRAQRVSAPVVANIPPSTLRRLTVESPAVPVAATLQSSYRFDGADIEVVTDRPGLLVLPLNYALRLKARVNEAPAEVWRVNAALAGVLVPAGQSRVEVRLVPDAYRWIAASQMLCVVALFALLIVVAVRARRATASNNPETCRGE